MAGIAKATCRRSRLTRIDASKGHVHPATGGVVLDGEIRAKQPQAGPTVVDIRDVRGIGAIVTRTDRDQVPTRRRNSVDVSCVDAAALHPLGIVRSPRRLAADGEGRPFQLDGDRSLVIPAQRPAQSTRAVEVWTDRPVPRSEESRWSGDRLPSGRPRSDSRRWYYRPARDHRAQGSSSTGTSAWRPGIRAAFLSMAIQNRRAGVPCRSWPDPPNYRSDNLR